MKHPLPPLDRLKVFEAAARLLSFSAAADELCLSKGAVSYQIRKLEEHVGCDLFRREVRQVLLTDAGQLLQQQTRKCFNELTDTFDALDRHRRTELVIAATTYVTARWLSSRLVRFTAQHPDVDLRFRHGVDQRDFALRDCDIALRWGPCPDTPSPEVVRELPMPLTAVASPALLQRRGWQPGRTLQLRDLLDAPWRDTLLLAEDRHEDLWQLWAGEALPHPQRVISDANVRVQAAIDGHGWILADDLMVPELNAGLLVSPLKQTLEGYGYRLMQSPVRRHKAASALAHFLATA